MERVLGRQFDSRNHAFSRRGKHPLRQHVTYRRRSRLHVSAVLTFPDPSLSPQGNNPFFPRQRSSVGEVSKNKDTPLAQQTTSTIDEPVFLELTTAENVSLALSAMGGLVLLDGTGRLVAQANLHLPPSCAGVEPVVVDSKRDGTRLVDAIIRWGSVEAPLAELYVSALSASPDTPINTSTPVNPPPTTLSLSRGFSLDFRVPCTSHEEDTSTSTCAEIGIHLASSGFWFGGGHFIRQLWPLNDAALEVGPWFAFDNGPNGVNTLLGTSWMTSNGLLVTVDPDTQFLHVGMNAPLGRGMGGWAARRWGVGIQNATRELLPLTSGHGRVARAGCDGLLRVQARSSYKGTKMEHPLKEWKKRGSLTSSSSSMSTDSELDVSASVVAMTDDNKLPMPMMSVKLTLSATENAAEACKMALKSMTPPMQAPAAEVLRAPIWTTWARYKTKVDQSKVLTYAREIADRGLPRSVMEIDDRWQTAYGDLCFDPKKFQNPRAMVDELHDLGFKTTVWVHPFVEAKSSAYREGAAHGFLVGSDMGTQGGGGGSGGGGGGGMGALTGPGGLLAWLQGTAAPPVIPVAPGGSAPGFFAWWNQPPVAALDVTNPDAVDWFVGRLKDLQAATGIDGFKFDAGEPCFLPRNPQTYAPLNTPADYTRLYVKNVAGQFAGGVSEVRTGHLTQDVALLCRMGDRFSTWDAGNGLRSLIPTLLTSGVLGYPFCLPDLVAGNSYFGNAPDSELLVRWTQASVLMPTLQFSIPPWDLNLEAERMVAGALDVRRRMEGLLLSLAEEAAQTLTPICRPLWMLAPHDEQTYEIHDQFALGDHVIVAPVVYKGAKRRDVYLTDGVWREVKRPDRVWEGGQWLRGVAAPLDHLPVFVRDGAPGVRFEL